ncbi:MAG: hypothetical protein AMJ62_01775 [Myxococcales bacterium SG8_38]|nr:MAG: hypothetical protein AMJ62_01775 [Myxococcales bacterium SG8_38]
MRDSDEPRDRKRKTLTYRRRNAHERRVADCKEQEQADEDQLQEHEQSVPAVSAFEWPEKLVREVPRDQCQTDRNDQSQEIHRIVYEKREQPKGQVHPRHVLGARQEHDEVDEQHRVSDVEKCLESP